LPEAELERILHPLLGQQLLRPAGGRGYLLAVEPQSLLVEQIFAAYDHRARRGVELVGGEITGRLEELVGEVSACRSERLEGRTLADLAASPSSEPAN
jgi:DNA-binding IscR family transcriptional regulator